MRMLECSKFLKEIMCRFIALLEPVWVRLLGLPMHLDGRVTTITAGPEVRNFAQIEVGDKVSITYVEALAYDVVKPETATPEGIQTAEATARAKLGEKPGAGAVTSSVFTATIEGIDLVNDQVTLRGPSGDPVTFKVREPKNLRKVAVGDKVVITYDRALAISVEKDS